MVDTAALGALTPDRLIGLDRERCRDLVASSPVGRVVFSTERDGPTALPVNHVVDAWTVAFRSGYGSVLRVALLGQRVAFEVDDFDPRTRTGWSVLVRGRATHVTQPDTVRRLERLAVDTWADGVERPMWVQISMDDLSGRRIPGEEDPRVTRRVRR